MKYIFSILLLFVFTNIASSEQILYEFTASWCVPCKVLHNEIKEDAEIRDIIDQYDGILKIDIDRFPYLKKRFDITTIPHFVIAEITDSETGTHAMVKHRWVPSREGVKSLKKFLKQHLIKQ